NAGEGVVVSAAFKATSRAGVAEATWKQPTKVEPTPPPPSFAGPVDGTAFYGEAQLGAGNKLEGQWSGSVRLRQAPPTLPPDFPGAPADEYTIESGSILYTYKGRIGGCDVAGSETIDLASQTDLMSLRVLSLFDGEPRRYQFVIPMPVFATVHGNRSKCKEP